MQHLIPESRRNDLHEVSGRIQLDQLRAWVGSPKAGQKTQVVVCGPEGYVATGFK